MATVAGIISTLGGLNTQVTGRLYVTGVAADAKLGFPQWTDANPAKEEIAVFDENDFISGAFNAGDRLASFQVTHGGLISNSASVGASWFEDVHVIPRSIEVGNLLTQQTFNFEVFNGFRYSTKEFTSFVNNAGAGISTSGLPALPTDVFQLDTVAFDVIVSTEGTPTINGTLDVVFGGESISVPITGLRVVVFPYKLEAPMNEELEFLTDILEKIDGTEQRIAMRKNPRKRLLATALADNSRERQRISNLLFDWQPRVFGVPLRTQQTKLTSAAAINDTVINVATTANADFRVGDMAIVLQDDETFDALVVASTTATTVTFESGLVNAYAAGTQVYPVSLMTVQGNVGRAKEKRILEAFKINFLSTANDANLADTTGFLLHPTDSKVILDGNKADLSLNITRGTSRESMRRRVSFHDSRSGLFEQTSPWEQSKETNTLRMYSSTRESVWDVYQLLHHLRGRQTSFYLPTFSEDILVNTDISSGGSTLQFDHVGYDRFVDSKTPRDLMRLTTTAGDEYIFAVTASSEVDADNESLTVTVLLKNGVAAGPTWPDAISSASVSRVEYIQKVRLDSDKVKIQHLDGSGQAFVEAPVITVFE